MKRLTVRDNKGTAYWVDRKGCCFGGYRTPKNMDDQKRLERLAAYEDTGWTPEKIQEMKNLEEWIYQSDNPPDCDFEKTIRAVENVLGFKLFVWQKTYIERGYYRRMGATTAEILRDLLDVSAPPIDYRRRAETEREKFYRRELWEMKRKLDDAGIPTRTVFFSESDRRTWIWTRRDKP